MGFTLGIVMANFQFHFTILYIEISPSQLHLTFFGNIFYTHDIVSL